jgi:hypothetical protein
LDELLRKVVAETEEADDGTKQEMMKEMEEFEFRK